MQSSSYNTTKPTTASTTTTKPLATATTTTTVAQAPQPVLIQEKKMEQEVEQAEPGIGLSGGAVAAQEKQESHMQMPNPMDQVKDLMEKLKPEPPVEYPIGLSGGAVVGTEEDIAKRERERQQMKSESQSHTSSLLQMPDLKQTLGLGQHEDKEYGIGLSGGAVEGTPVESQPKTQKAVVGVAATTTRVTDPAGRTQQATAAAPIVADVEMKKVEQPKPQPPPQPKMECEPVQVQAVPVQTQTVPMPMQTQTIPMPPMQVPVQQSVPVQVQHVKVQKQHQQKQQEVPQPQPLTQPVHIDANYMQATSVGTQSREFIPPPQPQQQQQTVAQETSVLYPQVDATQAAHGQRYAYEFAQDPVYTGFAGQGGFGTQGGFLVPPSGYSVPGGYGPGVGATAYGAETGSYGVPMGGYGSQQAPQAELQGGQKQQVQPVLAQQQQPVAATTVSTTTVGGKTQTQSGSTEPSTLRRSEGVGGESSFMGGRRA